MVSKKRKLGYKSSVPDEWEIYLVSTTISIDRLCKKVGLSRKKGYYYS